MNREVPPPSDADRPTGDVSRTPVPARPPLRLRHPLECLPYRPPQKPRWEPRIAAAAAPPAREGEWLAPSFRVADDLGAVRVNFVYAGFQSVAAAYSDKARRDQYFESSNETHGFRRHTVDTDIVEILYQPMTLEWETLDGREYSLTFDYGVGTAAGEVMFGEDKATLAYLLDPHVRSRLDFAESLLVPLGAGLERRVAGGAANALQRRVVKDVFDGQRTRFEPRDEQAVLETVRREGGCAPFGRVLETLDRHAARGRNMVFAMSCKRVVAIPLDRPPMLDTPVWIPSPRVRAAPLRDFLTARLRLAEPEPEKTS